jgi:hypothetical protein
MNQVKVAGETFRRLICLKKTAVFKTKLFQRNRYLITIKSFEQTKRCLPIPLYEQFYKAPKTEFNL